MDKQEAPRTSEVTLCGGTSTRSSLTIQKTEKSAWGLDLDIPKTALSDYSDAINVNNNPPKPDLKRFKTFQTLNPNYISVQQQHRHLNQTNQWALFRKKLDLHLHQTLENSDTLNINSTLPEEILLQIFHHLHNQPKTLSSIAVTCKKWGRLLRDNNLWKQLCSVQNYTPILLSQELSSLKLRCRCTSATRSCKTTTTGGSTQLAFMKGTKKCNVLWKGVSLAPWKAVYKQNHLTFMNWMTGKYTKKSAGFGFPHIENSLCLAVDENWAVMISQGEPGKLMDVKRGVCHLLLSGHDGIISAVKLTPKFVLTGGVDATVKIWNVETKECVRTLSGHESEIVAIQVGNHIIVTGSEDNTIRVWKSSSGELLQILRGHTGAVCAVQISGEMIVSGSIDHSIRVWNWKSGKCINILRGHQGYVYCLQLHNTELISGSSDGSIKIWNLSSKSQCQRTLEGHEGGVICLQADSHKIVSGSGDYSVKVWDRKSGRCLYTLRHHSATVWNLNCVGTKLMTTSFDTALVVLDFAEEIADEEWSER
ncbi:WD40-repeat-containing domain protein [Obelidium mucronatum]|nr:WD40-repeat-containing domain protein [Obelidium mucronatum]